MDLVSTIIRALRAVRPPERRAVCVAIDGRSGAGKSTLAARLAAELKATVVESDLFYSGGTGLRVDPPAQRANECIDWRRQRLVVEKLVVGLPVQFRPFDWDTFDGTLAPEAVTLDAAGIIIVEGVYSGRPELADIVDLAVLVEVADEERLARLVEREGTIGPWERQWQEAEDWYFANGVLPERFDLVLRS